MQSLFKRPIQYFFAVVGIVLVFLSMYTIQDFTKFQVTPVSPIRLAPLIVGMGFVLLSLAWYASPHITVPLSWTTLVKIKATSNGFMIQMSHAVIEVCFGHVEDFHQDIPGCLVALPANDLFDDQCINDRRSALGAFVNSQFPNQVHEICRITREKVSALRTHKRFQLGTTLYFDHPLSKQIKMAFLAVTTVIEGEGIRCEASDIYTSIKGLHRLMNSERLDSIVMPIIGSGHGGLRPPISFLCMLIAFAECLREPSGPHIQRVRIVVFQKTNVDRPTISRWEVRHLLAFVKRYC